MNPKLSAGVLLSKSIQWVCMTKENASGIASSSVLKS